MLTEVIVVWLPPLRLLLLGANGLGIVSSPVPLVLDADGIGTVSNPELEEPAPEGVLEAKELGKVGSIEPDVRMGPPGLIDDPKGISVLVGVELEDELESGAGVVSTSDLG